MPAAAQLTGVPLSLATTCHASWSRGPSWPAEHKHQDHWLQPPSDLNPCTLAEPRIAPRPLGYLWCTSPIRCSTPLPLPYRITCSGRGNIEYN